MQDKRAAAFALFAALKCAPILIAFFVVLFRWFSALVALKFECVRHVILSNSVYYCAAMHFFEVILVYPVPTIYLLNT